MTPETQDRLRSKLTQDSIDMGWVSIPNMLALLDDCADLRAKLKAAEEKLARFKEACDLEQCVCCKDADSEKRRAIKAEDERDRLREAAQLVDGSRSSGGADRLHPTLESALDVLRAVLKLTEGDDGG